MSDFSLALDLLRIPPAKRGPAVVEQLVSITSNTQLFMDLADKSITLPFNCCSKLQLVEHNKGQYVFRQHDLSLFYCIVLKGLVSVQLPKDPSNLQITHKSMDVAVDKLSIQGKDYKAHRLQTSIDDSSSEALYLGTSQDFSADDPNYTEGRRQDLYDVVGYFGAGAAFGGQSLLQSQPRSVSVCCEDTVFLAVLSFEDYWELIENLDEKKTIEKISFLAAQPLFRGWTRYNLERISLYFQEKSYRRNQFVFKEGDLNDCFYIIKEGEFKVTSTQTSRRLPSLKAKPSLDRIMRKAETMPRKINVREI
jgi:CRP-like cAMP-binding protein